MSLENAEENCQLPNCPSYFPISVDYMDSLGAVVACEGYWDEKPTNQCWAFDGSSWTPLPDTTQRHRNYSSGVIVEEGLWISGLQAHNTTWTSELFTGQEWIPGPEHPGTVMTGHCLVQLNSTHTLSTGGYLRDEGSWIYDWTAGEWKLSGFLNKERSGHGCAALEGQGVLVAGGAGGDGHMHTYCRAL